MTRAFTAVVNPVAGGGAAARRWSEVAVLLGTADVEAVTTRDTPHAVSAARDAAERGRVVVAVGGDGLVRDAVTGVVPVDGVVGVVAAGRGNDLAARLGLPVDAPAQARMLLHGAERRLDVLAAGSVFVPGNVYAGVDSLASVIINSSRRLPPRVVYRLAPYLALARWRVPEFGIEVDGGVLRTRGHIVVIANSGRYGHGLQIVPSAEPDDGRIDVLVVHAVPRHRLGAFMRAAKTGAHADWADATVVTGSRVVLTADRPVPVCADGDELDELGERPVEVTVRPGALRLLGPPVRVRPARSRAGRRRGRRLGGAGTSRRAGTSR